MGYDMRKKGFGVAERLKMGAKIWAILLLMGIVCSCGYQIVKDKGIFGGDIKSLYLPVFKNQTFEPHATSYATEAFSRELVSTGLFNMNRADSDGYIEGTLKSIRTIPYSLSKDGIVQEKMVYMDVELSLFQKNGMFVKRWIMSESEAYRVDNVDAEDYNKRDAVRRMSARMARKFTSVILIDY
jgi:hypothetical protein